MDYKKYHPDWRDIIRPSILRRDSYKCVVCGVRHKSRVYKTTSGLYVMLDEITENWAIQNKKKVFTLHLQVAHLDHNKENNDPVNLRTLCPVHHAKYDADHKNFSRIAYRSKIQPLTEISKVQPTDERSNLIAAVKSDVSEVLLVRFSSQEVRKLIDIVVFQLGRHYS